jgi:hypothetical protein
LPCNTGGTNPGIVRIHYDANGDIHMSCGAPQFRLSLTLAGADSGARVIDSDSASPYTTLCAFGDATSACEHDYDTGTVVNLKAVVDNNNHLKFSHWEGACTGTADTCAVTMDQARAVTAVYEPAVVITVQMSVPLRVSCFIFCVYFYAFDGGVTSAAGDCTVPPPLVPPNAGSPDPGIFFCVLKVASGTSLTLTAASNDAHVVFGSWSGDCTGTAPSCDLNSITTDKSVGAQFLFN